MQQMDFDALVDALTRLGKLSQVKVHLPWRILYPPRTVDQAPHSNQNKVAEFKSA
jgi:hypothetical protein